jgi:hypothetical protein
VSRNAALWTTTGGEARETIYTVPAGKRLIILTETAVTDCAGGVGPKVSVVAGNVGGSDLSYAMVPQTARGRWEVADWSCEGRSAAHIFADAGQIVEGRVWFDTDVPKGEWVGALIDFSGYLVDSP